MDEISVQDIRA